MKNVNNSKNKFGSMYLPTTHGVAQKTLLTNRLLKREFIKYASLGDAMERAGGGAMFQ